MINIAIDGYSSCGKSTLAKALAKTLHYKYIDTGSMYRALALFAIRNQLVNSNGDIHLDLLETALPNAHVEFHFNPSTKKSEVYLNDEAVEPYIRTMEMAKAASFISKDRAVRDKLQAIQRMMAARKGVIMDGRDVGTVVMPDAELKIFMTADPEVRAQRRFAELEAKGQPESIEKIRRNQSERDYEDENRKEDPLRKAEDAIVLDNTHLDENQQLEFVMDLVEKLVQA